MVEVPPPSKRAAAPRRDNVQGSVCDGIGLVGEWEHRRVCEGAHQCR